MEKELKNPEFDYSVYNLGISGDNTDDILERIEFETKQRLHKEDEIILIFAIGINDSQFICSKNNFSIPLDKFQKNIEQVIKFSKKASFKTIFVGLTPVDELKTAPILWDTDKVYKNEYILNYNNVIKSVCEEKQIYFIDMLEEFEKTDYKKSLEDGLHPNSEGHQKMFEIVKEFLMEREIVKE